MQLTGAVIIGRNEGERLLRCLSSVIKHLHHVVYVDSGSTDGSAALAKEMGASIVDLDMSMLFTAARGRNAGFALLMELAPEMEYVQFIDGDCELMDGWIEVAEEFLQKHEKYAVVCGRLRERYPESSVYNRLCDIEWNGPIGNIDACGGIFMIRVKAFDEVGGMDGNIIAGEEPDMCFRLRRNYWLIARIDKEMARHDANMKTFRQWWKRAMRSGLAYAQGYALHGREHGKYCLRDSLRIWFWAFFLPIFIMLSMLIYDQIGILLAFIYPFHLIKVTLSINKKLKDWRNAFIYGLFNLIGKFPQLVGQLVFMKKKYDRKYFILK